MIDEAERRAVALPNREDAICDTANGWLGLFFGANRRMEFNDGVLGYHRVAMNQSRWEREGEFIVNLDGISFPYADGEWGWLTWVGIFADRSAREPSHFLAIEPPARIRKLVSVGFAPRKIAIRCARG